MSNTTPDDNNEVNHIVLWIPISINEYIQDCKLPFANGNSLYFNPEQGREFVLYGAYIADNMGKKYDTFIDIVLKEAKDKEHAPNKRDIWIYAREVENSIYKKKYRQLTPYIGKENNPYRDSEKTPNLILECVDWRNNGLMHYQYTIPTDYQGNTEEPHIMLDRSKNITHAIYHALKAFFHKHQFHDHPKDSIFSPYHSENPIDLNKQEYNILSYYTEQFEKYLNDSTHELKYIHNSDRRTINTRLNKCLNLQGFCTYYRTLEKAIKEQQPTDQSNNKPNFDIEEYTTYIKIIENQQRDSLNAMIGNSRHFQNLCYAFAFALAGILTSGLIALFFSLTNSDILKNNTHIRNQTDSCLHHHSGFILDQIDNTVDKQNQTLLDSIKKIQTKPTPPKKQ